MQHITVVIFFVAASTAVPLRQDFEVIGSRTNYGDPIPLGM